MAAERGPVRQRRARRALALLALLGAAGLAADAGWIHAKAWLAQQLLARSWEHSRSDGGRHRPWPWADTHPVARLRHAGLAVDQIVVAGDSGRSLAFGPGWAEASAAPGAPGTTVLGGHRDTHFGWLRRVRVGDLLELQSTAGTRRFRIESLTVADARVHRLALDGDADRLLLVTCWPFDALVAGGPERYVVGALACDDDCDPPTHSAQAAAGRSPWASSPAHADRQRRTIRS
jgi:sortase A